MRIAALALLLLSSLAHAGSTPAGGRCEKSNECQSKSCFEHKCNPDADHPGGQGAVCQANTHCVSKNCVGRKCAAPKAVKAPSGSKGGSGSRSNVPDEEPEEQSPQPPKEEPLPTPTACSEDLMASVYKDKAGQRTYLFHAHDECIHNRPEVLARAKELFLAGYGYNFSHTVHTVRESTPEQLECAKKQYDKNRNPKDPNDFTLPSMCKESKAAINCIEDLASAVFKGDTSAASMECDRHKPEAIATSKEIFLGGYDSSFSNIINTVEQSTPAQLECIKKDFEFASAGRTKYANFSTRSVCKLEQAAMDCYFELLSLETKDRQYDDRNRSSIADACRSLSAEDIALTRAMREAGFATQWLSSMASTLKNAKPSQRACLKAAKPSKFTDAEKADSSFRIPKACYK